MKPHSGLNARQDIDTGIATVSRIFHVVLGFCLYTGVCSRGVMVKAIDFEIVVSEFVLQSRYYVHFRTNTLGKGTNPIILPVMG